MFLASPWTLRRPSSMFNFMKMIEILRHFVVVKPTNPNSELLQVYVQNAEPLTPAHLLYGRKIITLPYEQIEDDELEDLTFEEDSTFGVDFKTFPLQVDT